MNKTILIPIFLIITLALVLGVVSPAYKSYKGKLDEMKTKEAELQTVKDYYSEVDKISGELAKYSPELAKINLALPNELSQAAVSDYFIKEISKSGLVFKDQIVSVTSGQSSLNASLMENMTNLSLSGSYSALKNFLYNIEESARMIETDTLGFSAGKDDSSLSISLSLKFYSY
jgi:Tfp pilus assembly protein PilO